MKLTLTILGAAAAPPAAMAPVAGSLAFSIRRAARLCCLSSCCFYVYCFLFLFLFLFKLIIISAFDNTNDSDTTTTTTTTTTTKHTHIHNDHAINTNTILQS